MKNLKKAILGLAIAAVMALSGLVVSTAPAKAETLGSVYNNPISQWIVLSGLFNPTGTFGGGSVANNPISQWIVLSGLFGY
jgi:hypothetical protein